MLAVDIQLVELSSDAPARPVPGKEARAHDTEETGLHDVQTQDKLAGVHLACLAVRLVKDILLVQTERRWLACLRQMLELTHSCICKVKTTGECDRACASERQVTT